MLILQFFYYMRGRWDADCFQTRVSVLAIEPILKGFDESTEGKSMEKVGHTISMGEPLSK
jgi:hypothetical protein